jgi:choline dehydrogenase-like flavoprotein
MIVKTSDIKNKDYEYVVVGSGPAGLTVAQNIATEDKKVLLIEGGGWSYSEQSQQNYEGEVIGDDVYSVKTSRLRFFGGTSNHWGGMCRPLDTIDFTRFPIEKGDLDPYLSRASAILEIEGMFNKDIIINEDFKQVEFQSSPPVRFNKKYRKNIESSKFIDLALNISVLEIIEGKRENSVGSIRVSDDNDNIFHISVNKLIVGCGGIENSRLMLWSQHINETLFSGLTIGECWMEHPQHITGDLIALNSDFDKLFDHSLSNDYEYTFLQPTDLMIKKNNIGNAGIRILDEKIPREGLKGMIRDIMCINEDYGEKLLELLNRDLICGRPVHMAWEQKPVKQNKIELDFNKKDKYGVPRIKLNWRVNDDDIRTALVCMNRLGSLLIEKNIGKLGINYFIREKNIERNGYGCCGIGGHHMGGTPMGLTMQDGVVDKNLKVFNVDNMWIVGSSTFPGGGHVNPTLSIVQLSLRLAGHLSSI